MPKGGSSTDGSEFILRDETLDAVFVQQVQCLRDIIFKHDNRDDNQLCRKWLKVFNNTTKVEKFARNCLCSLMQTQLQTVGELSLPFTDMRNCNRDLNLILESLDDSRILDDFDMSTTISNDNKKSPSPDDHHRQHNHHIRTHSRQCHHNRHGDRNEFYHHHHHHNHEEHRNQHKQCQNNVNNNENNNENNNNNNNNNTNMSIYDLDRSDGSMSMVWRENEMKTENILLRRELETMRLQLIEKQIENSKLQECANLLELKTAQYGETIDNLNKLFIESITKIIETYKNDKNCNLMKFNMFQKIFYFVNGHKNYNDALQKLDKEFELIIKNTFEKEFDRRESIITETLTKKLRKSKYKLQKRFDDRVKMQEWVQKVQLKLIKLKCFSALRHVFIRSQHKNDQTQDNTENGIPQNYNFTKSNAWVMLEILEQKYQGVIDEII